jgi:TolA-binding protein
MPKIFGYARYIIGVCFLGLLVYFVIASEPIKEQENTLEQEQSILEQENNEHRLLVENLKKQIDKINIEIQALQKEIGANSLQYEALEIRKRNRDEVSEGEGIPENTETQVEGLK